MYNWHDPRRRKQRDTYQSLRTVQANQDREEADEVDGEFLVFKSNARGENAWLVYRDAVE